MTVLNMLGLTFDTKPWTKQTALPVYIDKIYEFNKVEINGIECLRLKPVDRLPNLNTLKHQIETVRTIDDLPVYIQVDHLTRFKRNSLLSNNIAFVENDEMVYLPFMATYLKKQYDNRKMVIEKLTLSAQLLFVWILYKSKTTNHFYIAEALDLLGFSNMTLTRAYRQLVATNLFQEHKDGRLIYLTTDLCAVGLLHAMEPYLRSPVKRKGYILKEEHKPYMVKAGISLLADMSDINPPRVPIYATEKQRAKDLNIQNELFIPDLQEEIEIWNYDPSLFTTDRETIDTISLILSFLDEEDERIDKICDGLLKNEFKGEN